MSNGIKVTKRDGRIEPINLEKMHVMVEEACKDLAGVSASQVEIQSGIQFYDKITTAEIQEILIRSASDLIDLDHPNYQFVAARLLLFSLRKQLYGKVWELPSLEDHITKLCYDDLYDKEIFSKYTKEEIAKADSFLDHDRDFMFTYAGLRQVCDKYLVQDRSNGVVFETPQFMYMMIALTIFQDYPKETRLSYVKRYYDAISRHKINIPTPIMAGVRTPLRQFASCVLVDVDDTLDSIFTLIWPLAGTLHRGRASVSTRAESVASTVKSEAEKFNTQVLYHSLKSLNRLSGVVHKMEYEVASATVHFPIWHQEIEDIIVLKNNKGTEDNRVRKLDYSIQISKLFYERFIQNGEISLFSPHDVPGLFDAFGTDRFDDLYTSYESDGSIPRKTVGAQALILDLLKERAETGRVYIMNIDHCNSHSSFKDKVYMSNLCQEITLPTYPLQHIDDDFAEIALCILSAINVGKVKNDKELEDLCDLSVRSLDELIDYQDYPVEASFRVATKARRSLGIGFIGLAHYLAKLGFSYGSQEAWDAVHGLSESFQFYLLKASNQLAKEKGHCEYFGRTKYAEGILPIDTYKKDVDELITVGLEHDWEGLRASILESGLRHSTLSAQMPSESSSVVSNATNGIGFT